MLNNLLLSDDSIERAEKKTLDKRDKHYVSQVTNVNINCDKSQVDSMYPWYDGMRMALLCGLPLKNPYTALREKRQTNSSWGDIVQHTWAVAPQIPDCLKIVKDIKNRKVWEIVIIKGSLRRHGD